MKKYLFILFFVLFECSCSISQKYDSSKQNLDTNTFKIKVSKEVLKKLELKDSQDEENTIVLKINGVKAPISGNMRVFIFPETQKKRDFTLKSPNYLTSVTSSPFKGNQEYESFVFEIKTLLNRIAYKTEGYIEVIVLSDSLKDSNAVIIKNVELY